MYSYYLKMIKMFNTEVCLLSSNYMHNRTQTAFMFKNLGDSMPIYPLLNGCLILTKIYIYIYIFF